MVNQRTLIWFKERSSHKSNKIRDNERMPAKWNSANGSLFNLSWFHLKSNGLADGVLVLKHLSNTETVVVVHQCRVRDSQTIYHSLHDYKSILGTHNYPISATCPPFVALNNSPYMSYLINMFIVRTTTLVYHSLVILSFVN